MRDLPRTDWSNEEPLLPRTKPWPAIAAAATLALMLFAIVFLVVHRGDKGQSQITDKVSTVKKDVTKINRVINGKDGAPGVRGADGRLGTPGIGGKRGFRGETGPAGRDGSKGAAGATGPAGKDGIAGVAGAAGPKGETGADGSTGPKGDTGATGAAGTPGGTVPCEQQDPALHYACVPPPPPPPAP